MAIDRTRSKRDIPEGLTEADAPKIMDDFHRIGENLSECQELALALGLDKNYKKAVSISLARFIYLFEQGCKQPLNEKTMVYHAEIRGRMSERLRLTEEMGSAKYHIGFLERIKMKFQNTLARIKEKGTEQND